MSISRCELLGELEYLRRQLYRIFEENQAEEAFPPEDSESQAGAGQQTKRIHTT